MRTPRDRHSAKASLFALVAAAALLSSSAGAEPTQQPPKATAHPPAVPLWATGAPGSEARRSEREELSWRNEPDITFVVTSNIHDPALIPYLPEKSKANGTAVIIAPGGGHMFLTMDREGHDFAKWLSQRGYAAFVLKYRLARDKSNPPNASQPYTIDEHARADAARAVQLIRSRAQDWNINPAKVGFVGFSAGGEVALLASMSNRVSASSTSDTVGAYNSKPDFLAVLYPGGLHRPEFRTRASEFPPTFLLCAFDDRMPVELCNFFNVLKQSNVNTELHVYSAGGHGFGVRQRDLAVSSWPERFTDWLQDRGF
jgi:acetyl esterase/lipase